MIKRTKNRLCIGLAVDWKGRFDNYGVMRYFYIVIGLIWWELVIEGPKKKSKAQGAVNE